jgi:hypothetical protein
VVGLLLALAVATPALLASTASPLPWHSSAPENAQESALVETIASSAFGDVRARVAALQAFSAAHAGTAASGLAQLESGRLLLGERQLGEAVAALSHADVARTSLADYAALALARPVATRALRSRPSWLSSPRSRPADSPAKRCAAPARRRSVPGTPSRPRPC